MKTNEEKILNILYRFRNDITIFCNTLNEKIEELEQMESSSEKPNKSGNPTSWIPVSERLPERDVNVLTYHRDVAFDYQYVSWIDDYSGKWAGFIGNLSDEVLAWMPLPEDYKEGSK